jgi:hypothetical protein
LGLTFLTDERLFSRFHQTAMSAGGHANSLHFAVDFDLVWLHVDIPAPARGTKAVGTIVAA